MPNIIDLFAGAGGLSLGAARAGFDISAAIELDPFAIETHSKNFPGSAHSREDVSRLSGKKLLEIAGLKKGELDGLIGGPPCQGFSSIGQKRADDTRNDLFVHFFRLVNETRPKFFLAENVPGILNERYDDFREGAFDLVRKNYVLLDPIRVKASDYGAPTIRTRIFFIGYDPRRIAELTKEDFAASAGTESIVVRTALEGLLIDIEPNWISEESGWRPIAKTGESEFFDHVTNNIPKNIGDPRSLERYFEGREVSGCMGTRHSLEVEERYKALAYGQQDKISKAIKLNPEGYCPTLRAGTGSDKGSYQAVRPIHPARPRVITPREAARLQGFPDWFVFHSTKWHSFRQIGNSVSPIVSERLIRVLANSLLG
ncbi:MAG: DNA cytosine methyltransferase [Thiobacillus sp.]|nr:MAG: DNA (cytosine-5-)-methyltransferase [Hydrogenophilales bacterium 16-64-40]OZA33545.1 MAG: DNA (cytosine-5-)-methyltransferase [Hydrogenophilales bacterium 17-64-65]HQT32634.1 DNA cytosine methyltransferase [Thiobacillus sp.]